MRVRMFDPLLQLLKRIRDHLNVSEDHVPDEDFCRPGNVVINVGDHQERVSCKVMFDTGAQDLNLISRAIVLGHQVIRYRLSPEERIKIQLASSCLELEVRETAKVTFQLEDKRVRSKGVFPNTRRTYTEEFAIVEGLEADMILGRHWIVESKVFKHSACCFGLQTKKVAAATEEQRIAYARQKTSGREAFQAELQKHQKQQKQQKRKQKPSGSMKDIDRGEPGV